MNLDTLLDIFSRSIEVVTKCIENRRANEMSGQSQTDSNDSNFIHIGEPTIEVVLQELFKIKLMPESESDIICGGAIYEELWDRLYGNVRRGVESAIIEILRPFREYSHSMFPDTLYQEALNVFGNNSNEQCSKYFINPTPSMEINAKDIILADIKINADARGEYFRSYTFNSLSEDILRKTTANLHWYVIDFAVMLDCILLEKGYDLLELQNLHNIKLIDEHKDILLGKYVGSDGYAKQLLSKVRTADNSNAPYHSNIIPELDNEEARKFLARATELRLMTYEHKKFKWLKSNVLLALFMGILICGDTVNNTKWGGPKWRVATKSFPDAGLENMFGIKNLGQQRVNNLDNERQKNPPRGYEEIMKIFE